MSEALTKAVSAAEGVAGQVLDRGHYIRIAEAGPTGMVALRADLSKKEVAGAVKDIVGAALPKVRRVSIGKKGRVVWMSPDELLVLCEQDRAGEVVEGLGKALDGQHHMVTDLSDARVVFRLTGASVGEVLAKGAPVDLSDSAFPVGSARRTHLGEIAVGFWRTGEEEWEIVCFRSLAHHLLGWLSAASVKGSEVGLG